jgi:hypothetical protein
MPKCDVFGQQRNLLICFEIAVKREARKLRVPACHCQATSRLLIFSHAKWAMSAVVLKKEQHKEMKRAIMQNCLRFRVCVFSLGGSIDLFRDVPPRHWDLQQPNWIA